MNNRTTFQKIIYSAITRIIIGFAVVLGATLLGEAVIGKQVVGTLPLSDDVKAIITGIITALLALTCYIVLFRFYEKRKITELGMARFAKNAFVGFLLGLGLQSLVILVIYLAGDYTIVSVNPISFLVPAFVIALTSGVTEELLIRGVVFRIMEEKLGTLLSLVISALLFGALHLGNKGATIYSALAIAVEAGVLLAAAYVYSRSLWLPIFLHFAWNFSEAGIYGAIISGNEVKKSLITSSVSGPAIITGGQFGPESSIQATIFCFTVGLLFLWAAKRKGNWILPYWKKDRSIQFNAGRV